jgi:PIN domain nuclease of toxin-antitoxin system
MTRTLGLSLGDRAGIALAGQLRLRLYTAERRWGGLDVGATIVVIG